ncbi:MAG TPA: glycosyl hydrolase, partial [Tepidisphaeraceae bacterium]|nr:glycosyl hydrolase [Tepidisphaeraceae bacterium]
MSNDASSDHVAKPWTRWWWMGNAVTREGITRHLEAYARVGLGGVEITPIYGAQGAEPGYLPLLGPAWAEMVRHAILEGRRLGIGVDMTLGSGWPYGGPHVAAAGGARRAEFVRIALAAGPCEQCFPGKRVEAAAAQLAGGELVRVPYPAGADRLAWDVPAGGATLFALLSAPTGQTVKRAAPGGAGLVMSPYSAQAFAAFIAPYDDLFEDGHPVPRCFFYDSFEVFGADCEADIAAASERRTGRRLADHLPALMGEAAADLVERVRHDYREVLAGLLLDEGVAAWVDWCRARGAAARYQAHGAPGNLIDLYAAADVPETEVFGTSRFPWLATGPHPEVVDCFYPLVNKLASSAAHLTGKRLVSSETFTWHREHYCGTFAQMRPEFDQLMLTGINHVVLHGSTYSPADVPFPGWQFYASTHFDVGHPLWREMPTFAEYVTFNQRLLQGSRVVGDVLVYFPFHDVISQAEGDLFLPLSVHKLPADMRGSAWGRLAGELWDA